MKVTIAVVPPGGGKSEDQFEADYPVVPVPGDCVFKTENKPSESPRYAAFVVRRRLFWEATSEIVLEVEPARYGYQSDQHKAFCDIFEAKGKRPQHILFHG